MSKDKAPKKTTGAAKPKAAYPAQPVSMRMRVQLADLGVRLGLFRPQTSYDPDSRFRVAQIPPGNETIPAGMKKIFGTDLEEQTRAGHPLSRCLRKDLAGCSAFALAYYHYDGYRALVYVEKDGNLLAAWRETEVDLEQSPRELISGPDPAPVERFLNEALKQQE